VLKLDRKRAECGSGGDRRCTALHPGGQSTVGRGEAEVLFPELLLF